MKYHVIYDGNCNLCVSLVQQMENLDQGAQFDYIPMQDEAVLNRFQITAKDCELGMILIDANNPEHRWQGSDAAEEIARKIPFAEGLVSLYRKIPGLKSLGDKAYEEIRDNRYQWFGKRDRTYHSPYPIGCIALGAGEREKGKGTR
ncbi:thiol-disulfide oxidoreductase DCC [Halothece sp. PCC 7418]|uniref:thiol-disulfide oxidoreductase DCC family protein n=1 Tax=Halothece sp. (strain PCC 7418) TaxID=65093 RepID=UPI0002A08052|nr:DCC1-like thiol-disulfide oxidoreductase family protein [Halothece sp. PCC 7418]AFZ43669.1 thiol-disulfide oxidoreductase DCC [Halothece sp. PCC 7418]